MRPRPARGVRPVGGSEAAARVVSGRRLRMGQGACDQVAWSVAGSGPMRRSSLRALIAAMSSVSREKSKTSMRDMHLHRLPWPIQELESLGDKEVQMHVTLSYFIEPNPSARGRSRYRYESYGLRFEVKRPLESDDDFLARINADARDEEYGNAAGSNDPGWLLGKQKRHHGSIHTDVWRGAAAALASRGMIGVFPAMGWWRTRPKLERGNSTARYALLVSIRAPETDIDLYTAIENQIEQPIAVVVEDSGDS